ncbi:MAG: hypothetical protein V8R80_10840 [Eubacterium sp.]
MESLTSNTGVTVTIAEKPVITFGTYTGGTVTAAMPDPKDETKEITVKNGDHVAPGLRCYLYICTENRIWCESESNSEWRREGYRFCRRNGETTDVIICMISNIRADQNVEAVFTALNQDPRNMK